MSTGHEYTDEFRLNMIGKPVEVRAYKRLPNDEAGELGVVIIATLHKATTIVESDNSVTYYLGFSESAPNPDYQANSNDVILTVRTKGE